MMIETPLKIGANGDFKTVTTKDLVKSIIKQVIMTKGTAEGRIGEIPWNPRIGCVVHLLIHQSISPETAEALAKTYILEQVQIQVPQITITDCEIKAVKINDGYSLDVVVYWVEGGLEDQIELTV